MNNTGRVYHLINSDVLNLKSKGKTYSKGLHNSTGIFKYKIVLLFSELMECNENERVYDYDVVANNSVSDH